VPVHAEYRPRSSSSITQLELPVLLCGLDELSAACRLDGGASSHAGAGERSSIQHARKVDQKAEEYWKANGRNYWREIITEEKKRKERYLGALGISDWITACPPTGSDEAWGIACDVSDLTRASGDTLSDLAGGLSRVLRFYDEMGIRSFNVVIFSSPFGRESPHGSVVLKVASRYGFQDRNVNDVWGLRYFLDESEIFDSPEDVAAELRKYFA